MTAHGSHPLGSTQQLIRGRSGLGGSEGKLSVHTLRSQGRCAVGTLSLPPRRVRVTCTAGLPCSHRVRAL